MSKQRNSNKTFSVIGIDIGKNAFHLIGSTARILTVIKLRQQLTRRRLTYKDRVFCSEVP